MRLSLRFVLPLVLMLSLVAYLTVPLVDKLTFQWFSRDIDIRAKLISQTLNIPIEEANALDLRSREKRLQEVFSHLTQDERLFAVGLCDPTRPMVASKQLPDSANCSKSFDVTRSTSNVFQFPSGMLHFSYQPMPTPDSYLILIHDMSFIERRTQETKTYIFLFFVVLGLLVSLLTVAIAQLSWLGWMKGFRSLLHVRKTHIRDVSPEFRPMIREIRTLIRENEHIPRDESQISWSAQSLREVLKQDLFGEEVIVVSNREPYIHNYRGTEIEVQSPASGLVTALEPIMRACSGTWVAHGSGTADYDVVDKSQKVPVPPQNPTYNLKRVWLTKEEEEGYYYGFSNEGLWPLCHIAHTRPIFRSEDWKQYLVVNQKFADAVISECKTLDPVILIQDYHLAMLPRMIKASLPGATIITFWHIPWPNAEAFGICPWREKLLDGLLGSDILGFHTRFHCNNFNDTVDRYLETRIDRDSSTISFSGVQTAVKNYPISIDWPMRGLEKQPSINECRSIVCKENNIDVRCKIGIGVDRMDYTKGILERFYAIERLLEIETTLRGNLSFIQIGAPTRSSIAEYQNFEERVRQEADRINQRFGSASYNPIILRIRHHEIEEVVTYFRAADFCFVSSLHDGMNLVAKEFAASRDDEAGVLILSQFTGAAKEMPEAIIVNPYNIDQCASAIQLAITMSAEEQQARQRSMRNYIQEFNVYRWAGRMLLDAARMRKRGRFSNPLL